MCALRFNPVLVLVQMISLISHGCTYGTYGTVGTVDTVYTIACTYARARNAHAQSPCKTEQDQDSKLSKSSCQPIL